jgi:hypothetical protein
MQIADDSPQNPRKKDLLDEFFAVNPAVLRGGCHHVIAGHRRNLRAAFPDGMLV